MTAWIQLLTPWLLGIGSGLGIILALGLLYLRRHPEKPEK